MDAEPTEGTDAAPAEGAEDAPDTEAEAGGEEASETEEAKAPPPAPKKWKLRDGTREKELTSEEEILRYAQIGWAKDNRFEETAKAKKERDQLFELFKTKPAEAFKQLGKDPRDWAEEYLAAVIEDEKLTPEQRELREAKAKLKAIEEEKQTAQKKQEAERLEKLSEAELQRLDTELPKVLTAAGLPRSPKTLARVAELWLTNEEQGLDLPLQTLVELAREQYVMEINALFGAADGEQLLALVGEPTAKKIRKADLQRLRKSTTAPVTPPPPRSKAKKAPAVTREQELERLEELKRSAPDE